MKTAFVHDRIVHEWWAEIVLKSLIKSHASENSKLFVLFAIHEHFTADEKKIQIVPAMPRWLNDIFVRYNTEKVWFLSRLLDYRNLMFFFPLLCWLLRKKIMQFWPNKTVISSFAAAKNVVAPYTQKQENSALWNTLLYLHSPMQYIRESYADNMQKHTFPIKQLYRLATQYLRPWDKKYRHYDTTLCNSSYTAELAKRLYNISWVVQYPTIGKVFFEELVDTNPKPYFVFVGRVQRYVREISTIIHICNQTQTPLIIIGDWPDMDYAKSIAWPTIIFVWYMHDAEEKAALMKQATWMINIAKESFGIATAEALCLWVPVLGYDGGGTRELINDSNGLLIQGKSEQDLIQGLHNFTEKTFNRVAIAQHARETFSKAA